LKLSQNSAALVLIILRSKDCSIKGFERILEGAISGESEIPLRFAEKDFRVRSTSEKA
jgi:hypothetical protein